MTLDLTLQIADIENNSLISKTLNSILQISKEKSETNKYHQLLAIRKT